MRARAGNSQFRVDMIDISHLLLCIKMTVDDEKNGTQIIAL